MMEKTDFDKCIQGLKSSSMFYMSLGSKELFHSNFLHWLSIICPEFFLRVMRELAGKDKPFWWEDSKYKIDVRREDKNFDLSIWVLDDIRDKKNEREEKWVPVLVLENKMKSLPYREQLEEYVDKAFDIWKSGDNMVNVKEEIKKLKDKNNTNKTWETKYGITFILLSLLEPTNKTDLEKPKEKTISYGRKNKKETPPVSFKWICKSYNDLLEVIHHNKGSFNQNCDCAKQIISPLAILEDYTIFVYNLYEIANKDWKINPKDNYIEKVCPHKLDESHDEYKKTEELGKLRIADIRDKIINDQLSHFLMDRLMGLKKPQNVKMLKKGDVNDIAKKGCFLCQTNYFHNVGLFEVIFLIKEREKGKKNAEPFFITIQIQGDAYMHGISGNDVVKTENSVNCIGDFWNDKKDKDGWVDRLGFFFDFRDENDKNKKPRKDIFPCVQGLELKEKGKNYKYDTNFIYQCSVIQNNMTINDVLECVKKEVVRISNEALKWGIVHNGGK